MNKDVLYHGTRYAESILRTGLFRSEVGDRKVFLSRSADVAAYWALVERDDDEGQASIFILNRDSLERRFKIIANPGVFWHSRTLFHDEAEEVICADVINVAKHLIGIVHGPTVGRSQRHKELNRQHKERIAKRLTRRLGRKRGEQKQAVGRSRGGQRRSAQHMEY
jgi:hypothetical protein